MQHAKQPGQPIDNPRVGDTRWNPAQITEQFKSENDFVAHWIKDAGTYPEITDTDKKEATLKLAWQGAIKNIADNEANGTPIVEKKK